MNTETIREFLNKRPFEPFLIRLSKTNTAQNSSANELLKLATLAKSSATLIVIKKSIWLRCRLVLRYLGRHFRLFRECVRNASATQLGIRLASTFREHLKKMAIASDRILRKNESEPSVKFVKCHFLCLPRPLTVTEISGFL